MNYYNKLPRVLYGRVSLKVPKRNLSSHNQDKLGWSYSGSNLAAKALSWSGNLGISASVNVGSIYKVTTKSHQGNNDS